MGGGHNAKLSLLVNDLPLKSNERAKIQELYAYSLPAVYSEIMRKYGLSEKDLMRYQGKEMSYFEKKLANRMNMLVRRGKLSEAYREANNYCTSSLCMYFKDVENQGVATSVFILPTCGWENYIKAVEIYKRAEKKSPLRHVLYLITPNCYE